jgi:hypothetical protein
VDDDGQTLVALVGHGVVEGIHHADVDERCPRRWGHARSATEHPSRLDAQQPCPAMTTNSTDYRSFSSHHQTRESSAQTRNFRLPEYES